MNESPVITRQLLLPDPNMPYSEVVSIMVWGKWMCCTLPAFKPDCFSWACLTPTAARGMLDCILLDKIHVNGKLYPAFHFVVVRITALKHPDVEMRQFQWQRDYMRLNGVGEKIHFKRGIKPFFERKEIHQRYISYIKFPAFRIDARILLLPVWKYRDGELEKAKNTTTYSAMFKRYVAQQRDWTDAMHFGKRMFPASFKPYEGEETDTTVNISPTPLIYDNLYDELTDRFLRRRYIKAGMVNGVMDLDWLTGTQKLVEEVEEYKYVD